MSGDRGLPVTDLVKLDLYQLTLMYICREMWLQQRIRLAAEVKAWPVVAI